jgi:hypothetical protein
MFTRSSYWFSFGKKKPIRNPKKAEQKKRPLGLELLEERLAPATITQWLFNSTTVAPINTQNGTTGNTVNQFSAGSTGGPTTGSGSLFTLGMYNSYNGGSTASDDVLSTPGTADSGFSEFLLRVRGASHNGWATHAAGAAQYTQGIEVDASTAGFTNISFSFDWYSTNQGIRDLQVQYNTNVNNAGGWTNFVAPGGTGANGISTAGTFLATPNDYWNATSTNGADTITVSFGSYANNDPNFGVRLVSAYDSTGNVPNDYAGATLGTGGLTQIYNNSSGNWRFSNLTFSAGSAASDSSALSASPVSPQNPGTSITLTDTITPTGGGSNPTGTVQFFDAGTAIGSPVNVTNGTGSTGVASLTVNTSGSPLSLGVHNFTAVYTSTNSLPTSTTPNLAYNIGDPTSSVVTASPNSPEQIGTTVTFTDTITPANIGGTSSPDGNPTGTVQFFDGTTALGSPVTVTPGANNTAVATYTDNGTLPAGTHNISAVFTATGNFLGSTSPALGYSLYSGNPGPFTPGNLVVLQSGDGVNQYLNQGPVFLNEVNPNTGANVQQAAIPNNESVGGTGNQPLTLDLTAAAGNGQLNRTYDGSGLVFGGVDSPTGGGTTPTGSSNRVIAVTGNDPTATNFLNTTTYGPFYLGDDNRGGVATSTTGPVYSFGHPNQAGGAVSQGVLYFAGPNGDGSLQPPGTTGITAQVGTQASSETNIRGGYLGIDGSGNERLYWTTAGSNTLGTAGIYTSSVTAMPTGNSPGLDTAIVLDPVTNSKVGGMFIADVNQDGVLDKGDRIYLIDDGTVAGAGSGGLFMATYDPTVWTTPVTIGAFTQAAGWSPLVRVAEGVIDDQPIPQSTAQLRGLTGTVLAGGSVQLYASEFDNVAGNNSYILGWTDSTPGALKVLSATHSGNTATVKLSALPASYTVGTWVSVNQVGSGSGVFADTGGFNGVYQITAIDTVNNTFSYTDNNTLTDVTTPQGATDLWLNSGSIGGASDHYPTPSGAQIVQTLADGAQGGNALVALRGVSFAPVAATTLSNFQVNGGSSATVSPGTNVTFTVHVANPQTGVVLTGLEVTYIDQTTNTIIGQGTIDGSGNASFTTSTPLVGNHTVKVFFAGGGAQALAPASGGTVQVNEAGSTASATSLAVSITGGSGTTSQAAIGRSVTLTATVTDNSGGSGTPGNNVSFYNGSVSPANFLGTGTLANVSGSQQASITTSFSTAGSLTIIAVYNGDNSFQTSQNSQPLTVAANATAVITSDNANPALNSTVTYTATLTGTLGNVAGTVQFFQDGTLIPGTVNNPSPGVFTITSPQLTAGSHLVTISYTPASNSPYNAFAVNTYSSSNNGTANVALIETVKKALTPGNLIAIQRGDGSINLGSSGYLVFLDEYTTAGVLVQRIALPNANAGTTHALLLSGQNSTEGLSNRSADGRYITIIGYDGFVGQSFLTSTQPNAVPRTLARIDANGNVDTSTAISTTTAPNVPYDPTDAVSLDGNQFWLGSTLATGDNTNNALEYTTLGATTATQINTNNHGIASVTIGGSPANAQLYAIVKGSGELGQDLGLTTVGGQGSLPTSPITPVNLPNLEAEYEAVFPTGRQPEAVALLNTADGTTINPNLAYIADQAYGLLKFWKDTGGQWHLGQLNTHSFGEKFVFAGGATGVVASIVNPGTANAFVNLYVTGSNVQQANPNQIVFFKDTNGGLAGTSNGVDHGFAPGSFSTVTGTGGTVGGPAVTGNFNGNENFAGLTFAPGAVTTTTVTPDIARTFGNNVTLTATVTSPLDTPQGSVTFYDGTTLLGTAPLNGSAVATFATTTPLAVGEHKINAVYNPGGTSLPIDDPSTGTGTQEIDYTSGDLIVSQVGFSSNIASVSVNGTTVTVTTTNPLPFALNATGLFLTVNGNSGANVNGTFAITLTGQSSFTFTAPATPTAGTGGTVSVGSSVGVTATSVATSGGITTVTVTTSAGSGFIAGQQVTIAGTTGGTNINGNFVLTSVSGTTLKYISTGAVAATGFTGATASSATPLGSNATATYLTDYTVNSTTKTAVQNTVNTVNLPTATAAATISAASWNPSNFTVTFTTSAAHKLQAGQLVTVSGVSPSGYNGTYTILTTPTTTTFTVGLLTDPGVYTNGGSALVDQNGFTEGGTATTSGYLSTSADGHSVVIAGNAQAPGSSLSGAQSDVGVLAPDGTFNDSTLMAPALGSTRAVASTDGSGFWVATSSGLYFVAFGGATPSAISAATWSSANGGTATITAPNNYVVGQSVIVSGIGTATGFNTTSTNGYPAPFTVLSVIGPPGAQTGFTYALATQPTGTPTFTGATSQLAPTLVTAAANNFGNSGQAPSTVTIGADLNGNYPQLLADAGNQFQNNGEPSIDGPFTVGSGLPTTGGQPIGVYGTGTGTNFPNARDRFQNFPTSAQFAVSPDGQTVFVADSRTDGLGGILEYFQITQNNWRLLGSYQLDNFSITGASEVGSTVTITTSGPTNFFVGESVSIQGVALPSYNSGTGTVTVTSVSGNTFTFTSSFSGLSPSGPAATGAFATGADGGVRALAADFSGGNVILYATTSGTSGNRLIEVKGGTLDGSTPHFTDPPLATAAPGTAFRGVTFAPVRPGTTASTTSVSASGNVLTATVTSGATGWVEFFQAGKYIGTALVRGGTATLDTSGILPAGTYSVTATYTGDSTFAPSSGTTSLTVAAIGTSTSLSFNPTTASTNASETLTATITVPAGQNPTGLVTFTNTSNSTVLGSATVNQVIQNLNFSPTVTYLAILTVPPGTFTAGTTNISAAYSGDAYFASSTGTGSLNIVNGTTTTVTSSLTNPDATSNQSVTLTATVTSPGSGTFTGTVQFYDNTLALGPAQTISGGGVASVTVPTSQVQSVTVASASASTTGGTTTVTITSDATIPAALVGGQVTVEALKTKAYNGTFTVTAVSGKTFSYVDNAANGAATDSNGGLAIFLNVLTPGLHSISAVYTPTGSTFGPSTGVHQQTVKGAAISPTDIFVERLGDGITSLNTQYPNTALGSIGATNYLDELTPSGTLVQSFILPSADSQAFAVTSASVSGTTVTLTLPSPTDLAVGQNVTVTGVSAAADNGDFTISAVSNPAGGPYTVSYTDNNAGIATGTGGTVQGVVHAVVGDGQQSTTGQMTLSGDGQSLFLTGYDNNPLPFGTALPVPTANGSNAVPRSIAKFNFDGSIQTEAFLSNAGSITTGINSTGLFNAVYSPDGNQFYVGGANGLYYFPSLTQSASLQGNSNSNLLSSSSVNGIEAYGGNLYEISGTRIAQVGTGLPTTNVQAVTGAPTLAGTTLTVPINNASGAFVTGSSVLVSGLTNTGTATLNGTFTLTGASATSIQYTVSGTVLTVGFANGLASLQAPVTQLPGFPTATSQTEPIPISSGGTDAYFTHLNGAGSALDTIYVGDRGSSFGLGAITKWTLTSVNINSITVSGTTATGTLASSALGLAVGQSITLTLAGNTPAALNGTFTITPTSATTFTFTVPSGTGNATVNGTASAFVEAPGGILYSQSAAQLGYYWLAGQTNGGQVTLFSTYGNGGNGDFGPGLTYEVLDTNGFNKSPGVAITNATWSGGTVTITANNDFKAGNFVDVEGVQVSGSTSNGYNGQFAIVSASSTQFTYAVSSNPGTATVTGALATSVNTVNSVAFEGPGGGFLGSETTRGVALAPVSAAVATTTTLTDNGPNPSAVNQPVSFTVAVSGGTTISGETVQIEDASNGNAVVATPTLTSGTATFTLSSLAVGGHNLFAVYAGDGTHQGSQSAPTTQTVNNTLIVLSTQQTPSGIVVTFNQAVDPAGLNEYTKVVDAAGSVSSTGGVAMAVTNGGTPVFGSVVLSAGNTVATFVKTGVGTAGLLPTGTDTLTLLSGANGFRVPSGGPVLTGTTTFSYTVAAPTVPVVSIPDFARGPGQVDASGFNFTNGIPLTISNGSGLTSAHVVLTYNPALFNVPTSNGVTTPLAGYSISNLVVDNVGGSVTFDVSGGAALGSGAATLANIKYTVPTTATYAGKEVLGLNVTVNGGAITVLNDSAVHVAAYAGDVDGSGGTGGQSQAAVAANDASVTLANAGSTTNAADVAFNKYALLDPKILAFGDTTGAQALVSANDASNVLNAAGRTPGSETQLPFSPTGVTPVVEAGTDPRLFFSTYNVLPGQVVTVALNMEVTEASGFDFRSADLNFDYDASILTNPSNIRVGTLDSGYLVTSNTSTPGQVYIGLATTHNVLAQGTSGSIALIDFTVASSATAGQSSPLNLVPVNQQAPTQVDGDPANVNPYPTAAANDPNVDGAVNVVTPTATVAFPAITNASAGATITVPVNLTAVTGVDFRSADLNFTYDPTKLQLLSDATTGNLDNGYLITTNRQTPGQIYVGLATTHNNLTAGATGSIANLTFKVLGSTGTYLDVTPNGNGPPTQIDGGAVTLSPAPTTATNDPGVDGVVNIVVNPNAAPINHVPTAATVAGNLGGVGVLFNPGTATGLHTATPNTVAFSGSSAISVTDADGPTTGTNVETTTLFVTGTGSTAPVGTLSATPSGAAVIENGLTPFAITGASWTSAGGGTATITTSAPTGYLVGQTVMISGMTPAAYNGTWGVTSVTGSTFTFSLPRLSDPGVGTAFGTVVSGYAVSGNLTDLNATLGSLGYTPGPGFYGTATLSAYTDDNGNSNAGGPITTSASTNVTVVGLFISEVNLNKVNTTNPSQYVEVFSTAGTYTIPSGVYLLGINGQVATGGLARGVVQDSFSLAGFTTGGNGYLALEEKGEKYTAAGVEDPNGNSLPNSGTGAGFGSGGTTSKFGTLTNVHNGGSRTGKSATFLVTDLAAAPETFDLVQLPSAPTVGTSTVDSAGNGTLNGAFYNSANIMDSVGILDSTSTSRSYGAITFKPTAATGTTLSGSTVVTTSTWVASYVGRIAKNTGFSNADWLASVVTPTGTATGNFNLSTTQSTQFAGQALNNVGGPNYWAPSEAVVVNDGSSSQHSQVSELTVTFNEPVDISDVAAFSVKDAQGATLSTNVLIGGAVVSPGTGASGVSSLVITFNAGTDTFAYPAGITDPLGNTVALNDGNYFLSTDATKVSNNGVLLDWQHNGQPGAGGTEIDEFWRLFGDVNGQRVVNGLSNSAFNAANDSVNNSTGDTVASATTSANGVVTMTAADPTLFLVGEKVTISGVAIGGSTSNPYNGTFTILSVNYDGVNPTTFTYQASSVPSASADAGTGNIATPAYVWYLDSNGDGNIDAGNTIDQVAFRANLGRRLQA